MPRRRTRSSVLQCRECFTTRFLPLETGFFGRLEGRTMIDFDRFWSEPGCAPGMTKEETEAYLRQQVGGIPLEALAPQGALDPGPGVTSEEIDAWEQEHGVRLPDVLRQALARQNGGYVRD